MALSKPAVVFMQPFTTSTKGKREKTLKKFVICSKRSRDDNQVLLRKTNHCEKFNCKTRKF